MRREAKLILSVTAIAAAIGLGGCVTTWDYPEGPVTAKSETYTITFPKGWAFLPLEKGSCFIASYDGPELQAIEVHEFAIDEELPFSKTKLAASMTAEQLVDAMYETAFKNPAFSGTAMESAGPAELGGAPGFQLIYTYTNADGLHYRVNQVGAIRNGKLVTVAFRAPTRHYYDRYDDTLPGTLASFRFN